MPIPAKYLADFTENEVFHVYNRTNNKELLFLTDENRLFFLNKYQEILSPFTETYCWCLLPNHFHFLIRVKSVTEIQSAINQKESHQISITEEKFLKQQIELSSLIEQTFKRFFQSYALAFNKAHNRKGNLFYKPFKRVTVNKESQFTQAIIYIHANPVKHKLLPDFTKYKWSSWEEFISGKIETASRKEVIEWFGSKEQFIKAHKDLAQYYYENEIAIEE
jgi:putative transposase